MPFMTSKELHGLEWFHTNHACLQTVSLGDACCIWHHGGDVASQTICNLGSFADMQLRAPKEGQRIDAPDVPLIGVSSLRWQNLVTVDGFGSKIDTWAFGGKGAASGSVATS